MSDTILYGGLPCSSPWLNSAGTLGCAPGGDFHPTLPLGAFVTNPVSWSRRLPASNRAMLPFPGGFLLHTGLPNPGFKQVLRKCAAGWKRSALPVWVHLLPGDLDEMTGMVQVLEECDGVVALEISIPYAISLQGVQQILTTCLGKLPLIVDIPLDHPFIHRLDAFKEVEIAAVSLAAPRGSMMNEKGLLVEGRLFGPAILPLSLRVVQECLSLDIPIIASGGVYSQADGELLLTAGASAVKFDAALWRGMH
jgi:dihydroorotate dehydrogenase